MAEKLLGGINMDFLKPQLNEIETIIRGLQRKIESMDSDTKKIYYENKLKFYLEKKMELVEKIDNRNHRD